MRRDSLCGIALLAYLATLPCAAAINSAMSYQGRLDDNGTPVMGDRVMTFRLFDSPSGPIAVSPLLTFDGAGANPPPVHCVNGVFTVSLDFGASAFNGQDRWLEISVAGTTLAPRQRIAAAPYALRSQTAAGLDLPLDQSASVTNDAVVAITNTSSAGTTGAFYGEAGDFGGYFKATDPFGAAVFGFAFSQTGENIGLYGVSNSPDGYGVVGSNFDGGFAAAFDGKVSVFGPIGIGEPAPQTPLHLSATGIAPEIRLNGNGSMGDNEVWGAHTLYQTNNTLLGRQYWRGTSGGGPDFVIDTRNIANAFVVQDGSGNVGLGIASPGYRLDVRGRIRLRATNSGGGGLWLTRPGAADTELSYVGRGGDAELWTGMYSNSNGAWNLVVLDGGNVGIGTTAPSERLHVLGNIRVSGSVFASCGTLSCSDERLKRDFAALHDGLSLVSRLRAVTFLWRTEEFPALKFPQERQVGFVAQEVQTVLPSCVQRDASGYYAVDYGRLTPVLVSAIQQQQQQLSDLRVENEALRQRLDRLERAQQRPSVDNP